MTASITKRSTMQEVIEAYPSAQRALFQRYHIGGCNGCGYQPEDLLEAVVQSHDVQDIDEVLGFLAQAEQFDRRLQVSPQALAEALRSDTPPRLIDVRTQEEWELSRIPGATLSTEQLTQALMRGPKDTPVVFHCHHGQRSLDAASYLAGHGFKNARSLTGGIDAWSIEVDASVPRYESVRDPLSGGATLRPLRAVVSQAKGCISKGKAQ
jgi:rhodanese-related sulfurtransferase